MQRLNKLYYLKKEIDDIKLELENLPEISSAQITGMPHSNQVGDPVFGLYQKRQKLEKKLYKKIYRYYDEIDRIEKILDGIDDDRVRKMARMRFILNKKWADIGDSVGFERTSCSKILRIYFEKNGLQEAEKQEDNSAMRGCLKMLRNPAQEIKMLADGNTEILKQANYILEQIRMVLNEKGR